MEYQELINVVKNAPSILTTPANRRSSYAPRHSHQPSWQSSRRTRSSSEISTPPLTESSSEPVKYWNEYDYGSEAGDYEDGSYAIYVDADESDFFDFGYVKQFVTAPFTKLSGWFRPKESGPEAQSLLNGNEPQHDYFSVRPPPTPTTADHEATEDEYVSSDDQSIGQERESQYLSFARLEDQKLEAYREAVLARSVIFAFVSAFILLIISGVLVATAGQGLALESIAGVTAASVTSLFCACMGLGAMFGREYPVTWMYQLTVWAAFAAVSILNGFLLVVVVGSAGI